MTKLDQAKRRDKKVYITEVAIEKVPLVQYHGFDNERNEIMRELAQILLRVSMEKNDSNEVALTCDIGDENPFDCIGFSLGTEHDVDVLSDTQSNHLIVTEESVAVVLLHNHPSTQTFSLDDIQFFLQYPHIEVIVVVSNQGKVHYLMREENYDVEHAISLFEECVEELTPKSPMIDVYLASLTFLAKCSEAGLYYR